MSQPPPRHVLISLGKSSPDDGGIFEFSSQLAQRIVAAAPTWQQRWNVDFTFHVRPHLQGCFGDGVRYLPLRKLQRLVHVQPVRYALWHSLNQLNKFRSPMGSPHRLLTVHDLNYLHDTQRYAVWREDLRTRALMVRTDHVVAISAYTAHDVRSHLGWKGPLDVIYNGARDFTRHARESLPGVDPTRPFMLHLSRMTPSKNPQALLALARVWPEMDFVLCGAPSEDAKALAAANTQTNVRFHLGISEAQKSWAYAHCAGFLFPSLTEGFGLPPIEAMHFGKPVFLARRSCLPEIGGRVANYFEDFNPHTMRSVVQQGLARQSEPGHALAIQQHAARFDWGRAAGAYLKLYQKLLGLPEE